jgi:hypothetical protein
VAVDGRTAQVELDAGWGNHVPSALGPQGRGRMERVHDVIGAWHPPEPTSP